VPGDPTARFAALVAAGAPSPPLDEALLLVAAHAAPDLDLAAEMATLDRLAEGVSAPTFEGVRAHLYDDLGFRGDDATYYDAANSLLPAVLERRRGIPITLAAVLIEVARRRGVALRGVGMPGHFLVDDGLRADRYLDPFSGSWLDGDGCRALHCRLHPGVRWDDAYLAPVTTLDIVTRVLANLAGAHRRSGDRGGLCWVLDLRLRLPGATVAERRELGLLLGAAGRYDEGAAVLEGSGAPRDLDAAARLRARLN
jgi:regulator of sirC expression with transglutaminase-like and TPR domain